MLYCAVRFFLLTGLCVALTQGFDGLMRVAIADEAGIVSSFLATNDASYVGGRGLITLEGVSGLFLNPTSGTLNQGQLTGQYCAVIANQVGTEVQHMAMVSYGATDWLEMGIHGRLSDLDTPDRNIAAGGPLLRIRFLKEGSWWPELSIGGMLREGQENLTRRTLFVVGSKGVQITANGLLRTFRLHTGFRQLWQDASVNVSDTSIGYIGGELELPQHFYFVGEVSNKGDIFARTPFSFGVQMRRPSGFALTLGGVQTGSEQSISLFAGIGFEFE